MKYGKVILLLLILLLFSGCLENITSRFQQIPVVLVNATAETQDNRTLISDINARVVEIAKINAPQGYIFAEKFPAIYAEVLQEINATKGLRETITFQYGQVYTGPGNYSFTLRLINDTLNKSRPLVLYSEIIDENGKLVAFRFSEVNLTE